MRTSVDEDGRVTIPADIRDQAGLMPGTEVDVRLRDGIVEVTPSTLQVRLERRRHLLVAVPEGPVAPLTTDEVEHVRDALLSDRATH